MSKYFLFLILLISINTKEVPNNKTTNTTKTLIDSKKSFNLTVDTIDTMIVCSIIMEEKVKKYSSKIESLQKKIKCNYS